MRFLLLVRFSLLKTAAVITKPNTHHPTSAASTSHSGESRSGRARQRPKKRQMERATEPQRDIQSDSASGKQRESLARSTEGERERERERERGGAASIESGHSEVGTRVVKRESSCVSLRVTRE